MTDSPEKPERKSTTDSVKADSLANDAVIGGKEAQANQAIHVQNQASPDEHGSATDLLVPKETKKEKLTIIGMPEKAGQNKSEVNPEILTSSELQGLARKDPVAASVVEMLDKTKDAQVRQLVKESGTEVIKESGKSLASLRQEAQLLASQQSDFDHGQTFKIEEIQKLQNVENKVEVKADGAVLLKINAQDTVILPADSQKSASADVYNEGARLGERPYSEQFEVVGKFISEKSKTYLEEQKERALGATIGTVEGIGALTYDFAKMVEFTCDVVAGNHERAEARGAEFGESLGRTIVSGIKLFDMADKYLYDVGFTGDYAKPFRDIVLVGELFNQKFGELSPKEQERIKFKLISEVAGGVVTAGGVAKVSKAEKFTEILQDMAALGKDSLLGPKDAWKAIQSGDIVDRLDQMSLQIGDTLLEVLYPQGQRKLIPVTVDSGHASQLGKDRISVKIRSRDFGESALAMAANEKPIEPQLFSAIKSGGEIIKKILEANPGRSPDELIQLAKDKLIEPPPKWFGIFETRTVDEIARESKHFDLMKESLFNLDPDVLLFLQSLKYKFHFNKLPPKIAKEPAGIPGVPEATNANLPAHSNTKTRHTYIPPSFLTLGGDTMYLSKMTIPDLDGSELQASLSGILRHEVGQILTEELKWMKMDGCHDSYIVGKRRLEARRSNLNDDIEVFKKSADPESLAKNQMELDELERRRDLFIKHTATNDVGWEQTTADLCAKKLGGSMHSPKFDDALMRYFEELNKFLFGDQKPNG